MGHFDEMGSQNAQVLEWKDTSVKELYAYLGILIYMGLNSSLKAALIDTV